MTTNKHWIFLEQLRRSGIVNMFGAVPYLMDEFGLTNSQAKRILLCWMESYNPKDYEEMDNHG